MKGTALAVKADSRMNPITLKILDLLADGEWHSQEDILERSMYTVPPGEAFRYAQQRSKAVIDRRTQDEIIASGQRQKAVASLGSLVLNGRVEREGVDPNNTNLNDEKRVRLVEDIPIVYVTRAKDGTLSVHPNKANKVAIHIIDAQVRSDDDDPEGELEQVRELYEAIPNRITDKDQLLAVFRELMNDLSVRATFKRQARNIMQQDWSTNS